MRLAQTGDQEAMTTLLDAHRNYLWSVVNRTAARGETPEDLFQWACLFFVEATRRFDPAREFRLSTWSYQMVAKRLFEIAFRSGIVKLPKHARATDPIATAQVLSAVLVPMLSDGRHERRIGCSELHSRERRPLEAASDHERADMLSDALRCLNSRERDIMALRLAGHTQIAVAERFGITRQRACQIESVAVKRLRRYLHRRYPQTVPPETYQRET